MYQSDGWQYILRHKNVKTKGDPPQMGNLLKETVFLAGNRRPHHGIHCLESWRHYWPATGPCNSLPHSLKSKCIPAERIKLSKSFGEKSLLSWICSFQKVLILEEGAAVLWARSDKSPSLQTETRDPKHWLFTAYRILEYHCWLPVLWIFPHWPNPTENVV